LAQPQAFEVLRMLNEGLTLEEVQARLTYGREKKRYALSTLESYVECLFQ
jgi:hypothetical protein